MIQVAPILLLAFWLLRALANRGGGAGTGSRPSAWGRPVRVASWIWLYGAVAFVTLLWWLGPLPGAIPWTAYALILWFPWTFATLLRRAGSPRFAYWVGTILGGFSLFALRRDRAGAPLLGGALALAAARRPYEPGAERITRRVAALRPPLRGAAVAARGLVAASRGNREEARDLLRSVDHLPPKVCPRAAHAAARRWLAADAAARGDWAEVARLGAGPGPRPRDLRFLAACALRFVGAPAAPSDRALRLRWWLAPRRRALRPLLDRALATAAPRPPVLPSRAPGPTPLARATALHALALAHHPLGAADLGRLGRAWSAALEDPETERALLARELALGADGKSDALRRFRLRVRGELAWLVRESGVVLAGLGGGSALSAAVDEVRSELLEDLEAQAHALQERADERRRLPVAEEWRAMARLRERYREAVRRLGPDDRQVAYGIVHHALQSMAVQLFNVAKQHSLGHATFVFLAAEAEEVGDLSNAELNAKNARCGS